MKEGNVEMWKAYDAAIACIGELATELAQRRADTNKMVGNCEMRIDELEGLLSKAAAREKALRSGIAGIREQLQNQGLESEALKLESLLAKHPVPYMMEAVDE